MLKWFTILLCLIGAAVGVYAVVTENEPPPALPLAREASVNPYDRGVAALGVVEPVDRDVAIVSPEAALVTEVLVGVGDHVEKDQPLYRLDTRLLEADLLRAEAGVRAAEAEIARWHALPRQEDVPPLEAAVVRAEALMKDRLEVLALTRDTVARGSGNERDISAAQYDADGAKAEFERAKADLAKMRAGGWQPDLAVSQAAVDVRKSEVAALKLLVDRLTVRAPRAGTVLRRDIEAGEYSTTDRARPSMILGDLSRLAVRAQVYEEDIGLVGPSPRAVARTRGAVVREIPLSLLRVEPYARPKTDLLGTNIERVDTRVIDVVFEIKGDPGVTLFPGQAVDVFVEAAGE